MNSRIAVLEATTAELYERVLQLSATELDLKRTATGLLAENSAMTHRVSVLEAGLLRLDAAGSNGRDDSVRRLEALIDRQSLSRVSGDISFRDALQISGNCGDISPINKLHPPFLGPSSGLGSRRRIDAGVGLGTLPSLRWDSGDLPGPSDEFRSELLDTDVDPVPPTRVPPVLVPPASLLPAPVLPAPATPAPLPPAPVPPATMPPAPVPPADLNNRRNHPRGRKKRKGRDLILGSASADAAPSGLRAAPVSQEQRSSGLAWVYVTRVHVDATEANLRQHVASLGIDSPSVVRVILPSNRSGSANYSAFRVGVRRELVRDLLRGDAWPDGVRVGRWFFRRRQHPAH